MSEKQSDETGRWKDTVELLKAVKAGDPEACAEYDARVDRAVLPTLRRRFQGGIRDEDDLAQEVKIQFLRGGIDKFEYRGTGSLTAFLRKDANYRGLDENRRRMRSAHRAGPRLDGHESEGGLGDSLESEETGAVTGLIRKDEHQRALENLSRELPAKDLEAIRMKVEDDASWETAARHAERSADAVRKRADRAYDKLRRNEDGR